MQATVKKITEIQWTRMIEDGWEDEYTEGMELLGGEVIVIRPMVLVDGRTTTQWFEGAKDWQPRHLPFPKGFANPNKFALFNWHVSWLKDFRDD